MIVQNYTIDITNPDKFVVQWTTSTGAKYTQYVKDLRALQEILIERAEFNGIGVGGLRITLVQGE